MIDGGFDCSGLTHDAGIEFPRAAQAQYNAGPRRPTGTTLQPGCLLFYGTPAHIRHVGLYLGAVLPKRRGFAFLTGMLRTAPAHQGLVHEPGPLASGLSGRRVSAGLVDRFMAMIPQLRAMDDVTGGGTVLSLAKQEFGVITELLNQASYDESTGRRLHVALAELGQLAGWAAYDSGQPELAQRYYVAALRAAHSADDRLLGAPSSGRWPIRPQTRGTPERPSPSSGPRSLVCGAKRRQACWQRYTRQAKALTSLGTPQAARRRSRRLALMSNTSSGTTIYLTWTGGALSVNPTFPTLWGPLVYVGGVEFLALDLARPSGPVPFGQRSALQAA